MLRWIPAGQSSELEAGHSKVVHFPAGAAVAIFSVDGEYFAIDNACPHQGGPLSEGNIQGGIVTCPWHAWKYELRSGCAVATPAVRTYPLRVRGSQIEIGVPSEEWTNYGGKEGKVRPAPDLHQILERIHLARTLDEVFEGIYTELQAFVPHNRLGLALLDEVSGKLVQVKTRSDRNILLDNGFSARISGSSLETLLRSGDARIIDDLQQHSARWPSHWTRLLVEEGMRSSLTVPLKVQGRSIGVVFFSSVTPRGFSESHTGLLQQIVGQLSILIERGKWTSELAQSNERYRTLFEMSNEGIFICRSLADPLVTCNETLGRWLGYSHADLARLPLRELLSPDFAGAGSSFETLAGGAAPLVLETELVTASGRPAPVELRLMAIEHRGERYIQGFVRDLSEIKALNDQLRRVESFENLIGKNLRMLEIYELIRQVAPMNTTVLIQGESGTGKELVARAIHRSSLRRERPFVTVNCGALVESLLESELFGHVRGAFSGATQTRRGRFELADGGTIFLDEVGDLSPATQVKLLRVLQEGEFEKVGSSATQKVNVRVIAATHRDLKAALQNGQFREDLYFRLHVVPVLMPPLRERREDIPLLVRHFIEKFNRQTERRIEKLAPGALEVLMDFPFPGNVRQLENIIEHAFVKCQGTVIERKHLPVEVSSAATDLVKFALLAKKPLRALEGELLRSVLDQSGGHPRKAAARLGISRTTLWRKLKRTGNRRP